MEYNYQKLYLFIGPEINPSVILRLPDNATIPNNPDNTDWQQYQAWLAQGNKPLPPEGAN